MLRERVAVSFVSVAVAFGLVLGILVIRDYNQKPQQVAVAGAGTDNGTSQDNSAVNPTPGAESSGGTALSSLSPVQGSTKQIGNAKVSNTQAGSGVSGDKIIVGGLFDMTGPVDSSVERDTVRAYFNKVNAAGGVYGRRLVLTSCDSRYDSVATQQCAAQMNDAHVLAIVGWTAPKGEDETVTTFTNAGIPIIGGLGTPNEYSSSISFPVSTPFTRYGDGIAVRAKGVGVKAPAIIYIGDVPWVAPVIDHLKKALLAQGIHWTRIEKASATDPDYTGHVNNLRSRDTSDPDAGQCVSSDGCADAVIAALDPFSYSRLFQGMARYNWFPKIVAGGLDKGNQQDAYGDYLKNAVSLVPFISPYDNASNPTVSDYLATVQKYYPSQFSALDIYTQHSWTSAMVFVEGLKRAGPGVTRASLVDALNTIQNFNTGWSKPISYGAGNHDPNHCFRWMLHDNTRADAGGNWRTVSDWNCF